MSLKVPKQTDPYKKESTNIIGRKIKNLIDLPQQNIEINPNLIYKKKLKPKPKPKEIKN